MTDAGAAAIRVKTIQKIRVRILPFTLLLLVVAFIDRINIGFAALTMNRELGITSRQFGLLTGIFFIGYFLFEIPSNLLLHKIGARVWIARILLTWGVVAVMSGFVRSVPHLYAMRFLLGLAEAGFSPGIIVYLTYWFRLRERARAIALFTCGLPLASIVGAPLSGLILDHAHWLGLSSWRWLLILEGLPAIACGFLTYVLLPSRPDEAKFLAADEKEWLRAELAREEQNKLDQRHYSVVQALTNGRVWWLASIYFFILIGLYTMSYWLPQLVQSLSVRYSTSLVGVLVMIPNLAGLAGLILVSRHSDLKLERRRHVAISAMTAGAALLLLGTTRSPFSTVALSCLLGFGLYGIWGPFWAMPGAFLTGLSAAAGMALINSVGNLGGFVGPFAVGWITQRTGSFYGGLAFSGVCLFVSATLALLLPKRDASRPPVPSDRHVQQKPFASFR
jgi:D-galactonate transporter